MRFLPNSLSGRWSTGLSVFSVLLLLAIVPILSVTLYRDLQVMGGFTEELRQRPMMPVLAISGIISALTAFVLGIVAMFRSRDRSISLIISLLYGAVVIIFIVGEFTTSH